MAVPQAIAASESKQPRVAKKPFRFQSAEHLLRLEPQRARTLGELLQAIQTCSDESIFQHTFRTLQEHHFIRHGYSNDFAHWASFACNENGLAERLSGVDVREFASLPELRNQIIAVLTEYLDSAPGLRDRTASQPFYFCSSVRVTVPSSFEARDLLEFQRALERVSIHSIHYHFIEARLRLKLTSNDFSVWLDEELGLRRVAELMNSIDIYTLTLQGVRNRILRIIETAQA